MLDQFQPAGIFVYACNFLKVFPLLVCSARTHHASESHLFQHISTKCNVTSNKYRNRWQFNQNINCNFAFVMNIHNFIKRRYSFLPRATTIWHNSLQSSCRGITVLREEVVPLSPQANTISDIVDSPWRDKNNFLTSTISIVLSVTWWCCTDEGKLGR